MQEKFSQKIFKRRQERRNPNYAAILTNDYCGAVSELSTVTQYINNENRLCMENCRLA